MSVLIDTRSVMNQSMPGTSPRRWVWFVVFAVVVAANIAIVVSLRGRDALELPPSVSQPAVRPLEARNRLIDSLAQETLLVSIQRLPNFDDTVWVSGSMSMEGGWLPPVSYRYERRYIPRLNRVRKILQQARHEPLEPTFTRLKVELRHAADGFEEVYWERSVRIDEVAKEGRGLDLDEPNEYYRRGVFAPAATYILSELKCFDALPLMADVFEREKHLPVSRLTVFYAMHLLAREHPREGLSPAALKVLDDYLKATKHLPGPDETSVTAWNASLEDTDFRVKLVGQDVGLDQQPQMVLRIYPEAVEKYEEKDEYGWYQITDEAKQYFAPLRRFVDLAYPKP
jgi:hypothetical protein